MSAFQRKKVHRRYFMAGYSRSHSRKIVREIEAQRRRAVLNVMDAVFDHIYRTADWKDVFANPGSARDEEDEVILCGLSPKGEGKAEPHTPIVITRYVYGFTVLPLDVEPDPPSGGSEK